LVNYSYVCHITHYITVLLTVENFLYELTRKLGWFSDVSESLFIVSCIC